jgi:hypothetical protein
MTVGLVSKAHRAKLKTAQRGDACAKMPVDQVVKSLSRFEATLRVAPALGLPGIAGDDRWLVNWCWAATRAGQVDVLARVVALGAPLDERCWRIAIQLGKVEVLAWLREHWREHDPEECPWYTGRGGPCADAAFHGQLAVLRWLRDPARACPWDKWTCTWAAEGGHLALLQWARLEANPPCPWDEDTCREAAEKGHLAMLQWARTVADPPCPWDEWTCACAAEKGHLALLQWARTVADPPCPWNEQTCSRAARGGHLAVLQWARTVADPPCPWNEGTCRWAVYEGHLDVVRWLRLEADPPCPWGPHTEASAKAKWPGVFD